jgi:hypothetical protein
MYELDPVDSTYAARNKELTYQRVDSVESTSKSHELWEPVVIGNLIYRVVADGNHVPRAEVWSEYRWIRSSLDTLAGMRLLDLCAHGGRRSQN